MAKKGFYILNGEIWNEYQEKPIHELSIIIDTEMSVVLAYGESEWTDPKYEQMTMLYLDKRECPIVLLKFDNNKSTVEQRCYVLRRCVDCSASNFPRELCARREDPGLEDWLEAEMKRVPLSLYL